MVTNVTSLSRNGLSDWLIQRVSAGVLALYVLVIVGFLVCGSDGAFVSWHQFMMSTPMKIFSLLAVVCLAAHAWVGLWTIATDYLKPTGLRLAFQGLCILANVVYVLWAFQILWGA